jgi:ribosomal protein S18 acetylase RimI-like enzyme
MNPAAIIQHAETESSIARCFEVMSQLRPHVPEREFVSRVQRQQLGGYRLAFLESESRVMAVAGYRIVENLAWGRFCYVDDLVTDDRQRSRGYGQTLFAWLLDRGREAGCEQFHLDSGVQRFAAHRFYCSQRLHISCHHFAGFLVPTQGGDVEVL